MLLSLLTQLSGTALDNPFGSVFSLGTNLSDAWVNFVKTSGYSEHMIFLVGTMCVHSTVFWSMNAFYYICYRYNLWPELKIQGKTLPNYELAKECLVHCFINHFMVAPVILYTGYPMMVYFGMEVGTPIPDWTVFLRDIVVGVIVNDTLFYWGHRFLHHKSVYKYVHKQHHTFKVNTGISSEYAHPIEHIFSNIVPVAGNFLMGSHIIVFWVWLVIRVGEIVDTHSGYDFKWSPYGLFDFQGGADRHEFHHSHEHLGCFGSFTMFWDWYCNTDDNYNKYRARKDAKKAALKKQQEMKMDGKIGGGRPITDNSVEESKEAPLDLKSD